ncbi:MAG: zinc ribbon domain-containing protein, partial [Tepidisphaeraceae bacterium]
SDMDDPDDPGVVECPNCRRTISEEAEWCHHCGKYISTEDSPTRVPTWVWIGVIVALVIVVMWIMR